MNVCSRTQKLIDESHRADIVPIEVAGHVEACAECGKFARERTALRTLLLSAERVSAPANFEARLNQRLAYTAGHPIRAWLNPSMYFKFAAAAAFVIILAIVIPSSLNHDQVSVNHGPAAVQNGEVPKEPKENPVPDHLAQLRQSEQPIVVSVPRIRAAQRRSQSRDVYPGPAEAGVVLFRGNGEDVEMPVRTVSIGAQPVLYGPDGRQPARSTRSSF